MIYLRAENSKTRKPETMPLEGELRALIERRRAAAVIRAENAEPRFAEYVFHHDGERIVDFRKAWATACVAAGLGTMVCPKCSAESTDASARLAESRRDTAVKSFTISGAPRRAT